MKKRKPKIPPGTVRIKAADLTLYEKTERSWKKSSKALPDAMLVIRLFKAHGRLKALIDKTDPRFLKGELAPRGKAEGARINILPNGKELDKAFSLFASHLTIHDEASRRHWNVIYKNPGGTYSYLYTLEKRNRFRRKKYKAVEEFAKYHSRLKRNAYNALKNKNDYLAIPMYTLLKTYMRIGNEIYYKMHRHKGLTTLKKRDIAIERNCVSFNYIGKDGVPTSVKSSFPSIYIERLRKMLRRAKDSSFIFVNTATGHTLNDAHFKDAFKRYCGKEFYPHIVRSHYATLKAEDFLRRHDSITKEDVRSFFLSIAEKLGHKRFVKNDQTWKENYNVTINHYIRPELVRKIKSKCL